MRNLIRQYIFLILLPFFLVDIYTQDNLSYTPSQADSLDKQNVFQPLQFKLGLTSGWKAPYGTGVDFSFMIYELIDVNIGYGISISGNKFGLGTRFYPIRNNDFSPMIGAFIYHSKGQNSVTVSFNTDSAKYRIKPDNAIQINIGARYRFGKGHYFIGSLGYSIPFKGEEAEYISGSTLDSVKDLANGLRIGGVSVYCGILIKLSTGNYRQQYY